MTKKNSRLRAVTTAVLGGALAAAVAMPAMAFNVTQSRLEAADREPQNWLTQLQNYSGHRYTRLDQINRNTIGGLKVAFTVPMNDCLLGDSQCDNQGNGLVDDGMMWIGGGYGRIYKIDLRSGDSGVVVWVADAAVSTDENRRTRGIAMWENAVFDNLVDGRVISVDRDTGEFNWDMQVARVAHVKSSAADTPRMDREGFTAAPIAAAGKLLVGQSKGDAGTRGWIAALDIETGEEVWRQYTVPAPGEFGNETWADDHGAWKTGGGSLWTTGSYDAEQRLTIWGTAQPVPMFDPEFRPGDNLFTNSAMAWDIDTGALKYYFQYTPNESWDYDENGVHMLIDAPFNGVDRKTILHFARNGYIYTLDRTNGDFINAEQYVARITWTAGIDPKTGMPVEYDPNLQLQTYIPATRWARADTEAKTACPALPGGSRWQRPAYNPVTMIAYQGGEDGCQTHMNIAAITLDGLDPEAGPAGAIDEKGRRREGSRVRMPSYGLLTAFDVTTGLKIAQQGNPYPSKSGMLATAGGLVFTAFENGELAAYTSDTLQKVWHFNTGAGVKSPFNSYSVNGKQYLSIVVAGRLQTSSRAEIPVRGWMSTLFVFSL